MKKTSEISSFAALCYVWKAFPLSYVIMACAGIANGVASVLTAFCLQQVFAAVQEGYGARLYVRLAAYAVLLLLSAAYSVWYMRYRVQFHTILNFESVIRQKLHFKSGRISNEKLETPDAYAFIRQADGARQNLFRFGQIYVESVTLVLQAAMITVYVSSFHLWFLLFLPFSVLPVLLEMLYRARLWNRAYEVVSQCRREETEYEKVFCGAVSQETRASGAQQIFLNKYRQSRQRRDGAEDGKSKKICTLKLSLSLLACVGSIGGFLVAIVLYYYGEIGLSAFSASLAAYSSLAAALAAFAETLGNEAQYKKMIQPFFRFLNMEERAGEGERVSFGRDITLKDVRFRYPNQSGYAIDGVSLTVKKGEIVAIVGENGAGKSTLANLLLGLYLPTEGSIFYDGADIAVCRERALHKRQSLVSQNFARYCLTAGENVALGDFSKGG